MMGKIFQKTLFWSSNLKIWEEVPKSANNNKTKSFSDKIAFYIIFVLIKVCYIEQIICEISER